MIRVFFGGQMIPAVITLVAAFVVAVTWTAQAVFKIRDWLDTRRARKASDRRLAEDLRYRQVP